MSDDIGLADHPDVDWQASHLLLDNGQPQELLHPIKLTDRIKYTCLTLSKRYIAFGATSGGIYIFQRETQKYLQVLANTEGLVTHVAFAPDDNILGLSTNNGFVIIWQLNILNRRMPEILITSFAHKGSSITCLQWDDTSHRLFSGDIKGKVTVTNAYSRKVSGLLKLPTQSIVNLDYAIVQLDFNADYLLVSSLNKCHICNTKRHQFRSVGKRLRDGLYGACFYLKDKTRDPVVYSARPGSRLWEANLKGDVKATHQFKHCLAIPPLPVVCESSDMSFPESGTTYPYPPQAVNFQCLMKLEQFLMSWNEKAIYILDTLTGKVVLWTRPLSGIQYLSIYKSQIYYIDNQNQINKLMFLTIERCIVRLFVRQSWTLCASICHRFSAIITDGKSRKLVSINIIKDIQQHLALLEGTENLIGYLEDICRRMEQIIVTDNDSNSSSSKRSSIESIDSIKLESGIYLVNSRRGSKELFEDILSAQGTVVNGDSTVFSAGPVEKISNTQSSSTNGEQEVEISWQDIRLEVTDQTLNEQTNSDDLEYDEIEIESSGDHLKTMDEINFAVGSKVIWSQLSDDLADDNDPKQNDTSDDDISCIENDPDTSNCNLPVYGKVTVTVDQSVCNNKPQLYEQCQNKLSLIKDESSHNFDTNCKIIIDDVMNLEDQPPYHESIDAQDKCDNHMVPTKVPVETWVDSESNRLNNPDSYLHNPNLSLNIPDLATTNNTLSAESYEEGETVGCGAFELKIRRAESVSFLSRDNHSYVNFQRSHSASGVKENAPQKGRNQSGNKKNKKSRMAEIGEVKAKKDHSGKKQLSNNVSAPKQRPSDINILEKTAPSIVDPIIDTKFGLESPITPHQGIPFPVDDTPLSAMSDKKILRSRQISVPFAVVKDSLSSTYSKTKEFMKYQVQQTRKLANSIEIGVTSSGQQSVGEDDKELEDKKDEEWPVAVEPPKSCLDLTALEEATISTRSKLQHPLIMYDITTCKQVLEQWLTELNAAYVKLKELSNTERHGEDQTDNDGTSTDADQITNDGSIGNKSGSGDQISVVHRSNPEESICQLWDHFMLPEILHENVSELIMMCFELQVFISYPINYCNIAATTTPVDESMSSLNCIYPNSPSQEGTAGLSSFVSEVNYANLCEEQYEDAVMFVHQFFRFLDINRVREVMCSWSGTRHDTYKVICSRLIDCFKDDVSGYSNSELYKGRQMLVFQHNTEMHRKLSRLMNASQDGCGLGYLTEGNVAFNIWEVKEILHLYHGEKGKKLFLNYTIVRMKGKSNKEKCDFLCGLCDDNDLLKYLTDSIMVCNDETTKMAICMCGSPRSGSHNLAWVHQDLLDELLDAVPSELMATLCYQHGYWQGCLKLSHHFLKKTILEIIWNLGDVQLLARRGLSLDDWRFIFAQISRLEGSHSADLTNDKSILCYQCFISNCQTHTSISLELSNQNDLNRATNPDWLVVDKVNSDWSTTITWENAAQLLVRSVGPRPAIVLLEEFEIPKHKLSTDFFQSCIQGTIIDQYQRLLTHAMLEKVDSYLWSKRQHAIPQELKHLLKKEFCSSFSETKHPKESSFAAPSVGQQQFMEEPLCHWGVDVNLNKNCVICGLNFTEQVSSSNSGILVFQCGHIFHSECIPEKFCLICFYSSTDL